MTKAPEHGHRFAVYSPSGVHIGLWDDGKIAADVAAENPGNTIEELVTLDHALALVAAAYEDAATTASCECQCGPVSLELKIRARTPDDAIAALERVKQEAWKRGMNDAADAADSAGDFRAADAIRALITEGQSDE